MVQSSCETSLSLTQCFNWRAATARGCQTKPIRESVTQSRINQSQPFPPQYTVQEAQSSEASFSEPDHTRSVLWELEKEAPHAAVPPADPSLPSASSHVWLDLTYHQDFCQWGVSKSTLSVHGLESTWVSPLSGLSDFTTLMCHYSLIMLVSPKFLPAYPKTLLATSLWATKTQLRSPIRAQYDTLKTANEVAVKTDKTSLM